VLGRRAGSRPQLNGFAVFRLGRACTKFPSCSEWPSKTGRMLMQTALKQVGKGRARRCVKAHGLVSKRWRKKTPLTEKLDQKSRK